MNLMNPAGGLIYHWRALMHGKAWEDYRKNVLAFLKEWNPPREELILVGPSAGYSLDTHWLSSFDYLLGVEIDPLARWNFGRRHDVDVDWIAGAIAPDLNGIERILTQYPESPVLFCNILGQVPSLFPQMEDVPDFHNRLLELLDGRMWASYHDRLSGQFTRPPRSRHFPSSLPIEDVVQAWKLSGTILDHQTGTLGEGRECWVWPWEIRPGYTHLIEGVFSR